MDRHPKNACPPNGHDLAASPFEAMTLVCQWPGCGFTAPASAAVLEGVDIPRGAHLVFARERAAA